MSLRKLSILLLATAPASLAFSAEREDCQPQWLPGFGDARLNGAITTLLVHDFGDGLGASVFAGGFFNDSDDGQLNYVARWDGQRWHALGAGMNGSVLALAVLQTESGSVLVAGGSFTEAGGEPAAHLAQWDGSAWSSLDGGVNGPVYALVAADDGASLIAGGAFTEAGGVGALRIAQWDPLCQYA